MESLPSIRKVLPHLLPGVAHDEINKVMEQAMGALESPPSNNKPWERLSDPAEGFAWALNLEQDGEYLKTLALAITDSKYKWIPENVDAIIAARTSSPP